MSTIVNNKVYRFNFRKEFTNILNYFATVHKFDDCLDFKEAFEKFEEKFAREITEETEYLESIGYTGNVRTKAFKSARYYFARKQPIETSTKETESTQLILEITPPDSIEEEPLVSTLSKNPKKEKETTIKTTKRKIYTSINPTIMELITGFLEIHHTLKPSEGFDLFCELNKEMIEEEIKQIDEKGENGLVKIKKTFKNKHFNKKRILLQQTNDTTASSQPDVCPEFSSGSNI